MLHMLVSTCWSLIRSNLHSVDPLFEQQNIKQHSVTFQWNIDRYSHCMQACVRHRIGLEMVLNLHSLVHRREVEEPFLK